MRPTPKPTTNAARPSLAWRSLVTNFDDQREADYLRDGIYELRIRSGAVNYRLLYFFHGRTVSVVAHGLTKEAAVPVTDINHAIARKAAFTANPAAHTFKGEINDV